MRLPAAYFALQLRFAARVVAVTGMPQDEALLRYTTCAMDFRLGPAAAATHPVWQAYLQGFHDTAEPVAWTYDFYLSHQRAPIETHAPCLSYRYEADTRTVRMQFANNDPEGSLSAARIDARTRELRAMFAKIAVTIPDAVRVHGSSWLYNLPAYTRLFPPAYIATARPAPGEFPFISSWGPFLDRSGQMKPRMVADFLARVDAAGTLAALEDAFPYRVIAVACGIEEFYRFYAVNLPLPTGSPSLVGRGSGRR